MKKKCCNKSLQAKHWNESQGKFTHARTVLLLPYVLCIRVVSAFHRIHTELGRQCFTF